MTLPSMFHMFSFKKSMGDPIERDYIILITFTRLLNLNSILLNILLFVDNLHNIVQNVICE
jgi:hypothetical protein